MPDQFRAKAPVSPRRNIGALFQQAAARYIAENTPQAAPEEDPAAGTRIGDYTRSLALGLQSLGVVGGKAMEALGLDRAGQAVQDLYRSRQAETAAGFSPAMQAERAKPFVADVPEGEGWFGSKYAPGPGLTSVPKIVGLAAESAPATAAGMGVGGAIAAPLARLGLSPAAAGAIGYGTGEAALSAGMAASDIQDHVMQVPEEVLAESEEYRAAYHAQAPDMPDLERRRVAREQVAGDAARSGALPVAISTFIFSSPAGAAFGKMLGGEVGKTLPRTILKGAGIEAMQEAPQSAGEQYFSNLAVGKLDPSVTPGQGVLEQAVGGGVAGFGMGGAFGSFAHGAAQAQPQDQPSPEQAPAQARPLSAADRLIEAARRDYGVTVEPARNTFPDSPSFTPQAMGLTGPAAWTGGSPNIGPGVQGVREEAARLFTPQRERVIGQLRQDREQMAREADEQAAQTALRRDMGAEAPRSPGQPIEYDWQEAARQRMLEGYGPADFSASPDQFLEQRAGAFPTQAAPPAFTLEDTDDRAAQGRLARPEQRAPDPSGAVPEPRAGEALGVGLVQEQAQGAGGAEVAASEPAPTTPGLTLRRDGKPWPREGAAKRQANILARQTGTAHEAVQTEGGWGVQVVPQEGGSALAPEPVQPEPTGAEQPQGGAMQPQAAAPSSPSSPESPAPGTAAPVVAEMETTAPAEKQPWEMTRDEWAKATEISYIKKRGGSVPAKAAFDVSMAAWKEHAYRVKDALSEGKPVPAAVLEDYRGQEWADAALSAQPPAPAPTMPQAAPSAPAPAPVSAEAGNAQQEGRGERGEAPAAPELSPENMAILRRAAKRLNKGKLGEFVNYVLNVDGGLQKGDFPSIALGNLPHFVVRSDGSAVWNPGKGRPEATIIPAPEAKAQAEQPAAAPATPEGVNLKSTGEPYSENAIRLVVDRKVSQGQNVEAVQVGENAWGWREIQDEGPKRSRRATREVKKALRATKRDASGRLDYDTMAAEAERLIEQGYNVDDVYETLAEVDEKEGAEAPGQGTVRASRLSASTAGIPLSSVESAVKPLQSMAVNAVGTRVVQTTGDVPPRALNRFRRQGGGFLEAIYDEDTRTVYMVADNISSESRAVALWLHEQGLHVGLKGIFPDEGQYRNALDLVALSMPRHELRSIMRLYGLAETLEGRLEAAEEYLARVAEKVSINEVLAPREQTVWERFTRAVRSFLRRALGRRLGAWRLTDGEMAEIVMDSVRWTVTGKPRGEARRLYQEVLGEALAPRLGGGMRFSRGEEQGQEQRGDVTETPEFKRWFGKSRVVDEQGKPLVVYHGTNAKKFDSFDTSKEGAHFGTSEQAATRIYKNRGGGGRSKSIAVFLSIKNPLRLQDIGVWSYFNNLHGHLSVNDHITIEQADAAWDAWQKSDNAGWQAIKNALNENGYDGIVYENEVEGRGDSYIAFSPTQIKSVFNRGTFDPTDPRIRFSRAASAPSPAAFTPEVEARWQEARRGIADRRTLLRRTHEAITSTVARFAYLPDLPKTADLAEAREIIRQFEAAPSVAKSAAVRMLKNITGNLSRAEYDLFSRKVLLDDLAVEVDREHELPFGFTPESVAAAKAEVDQMAGRSEAVTAAAKLRAEALEKTKRALLDAGVMTEEQFSNPSYFRHQVLEYAMERQGTQGASKVRRPRPGYAKKREGSTLDINANYLEAEFEYLHRALIDVAASKTIDRLREKYDKRPEALAQAKKWNEAHPGQPKRTWKDFIPAGYAAWSPEKGSAFFTGKSTTERAIGAALDAIQTEGLDAVTREELEDVLQRIGDAEAKRGKMLNLVVPEALATTLGKMTTNVTRGWMDDLFRTPMKLWKQWVLINPRRVLKYNLNNLSGDLDAVIAGSPKALRRMPQAIRELYAVMKGGEPTARMQEAIDRGVFDTGLTIQEIPEINALDEFRGLRGQLAAKDMPIEAARRVWRTLKDFTQFRENWLRYAAYLDYAERLEGGESMQSIGYGAAYKPLVDGLTDTKDKAALLARELLGDYGAVSEIGQELRTKLIPFYSWLEINTRRYLRLFNNAAAQGIGQGLKTAGTVGALKGARLTAWLGVRSFVLYGLVQLWNNLMFPDLEDELDANQGARLHLTLGRDKDGNVLSLRFQGALSDFFSWIGLEDAAGVLVEVEKGRAGYGDLLETIGKAPVNKLVGGVTPLIRTPVEMAAKRSFWPDVFNPRVIRDREREFARLFSLENERDWLRGAPSRGYWRSWVQGVVFEGDPREMAFNSIRGKKYDWMRRVLGKDGSGDFSSPRSEALRQWRMALKFGDREAVARTRKKLREMGVNGETLRRSIKSQDPLYGLNARDRRRFLGTLSQDEKKQLELARRFYRETYLQGGAAPVQ
jgi:hypothetical protein